MVKTPKKRPIIFLDVNLDNNQRKLTLLHEIGHYLLHWGIDTEYENDDKMEVVFRTDLIKIDDNELSYENQANIFATHIMYNIIDFNESETKLNNEERLFITLNKKFISKIGISSL